MINPTLRPLRWILLGTLATACAATGDGSYGFGVIGDGGGFGTRSDARVDARVDARANGGGDGGAAAGDGGGMSGGGDVGVSPVEDASGSVGEDGGGSTDPDGGGGVMSMCGTREVCGNQMDDNCNDRVDEDCPCVPGTMQRCYPGDPARAGRGVCTWGTQSCTGSGEFGTWTACEGFGTPQPVVCGRMMDFRCNGVVDEGCECRVGDARSCYTGPMGTAGVGACRAGSQTCAATMGGSAWGPCTGEVRPEADRCDGMDRDCDGNPNTTCACTRGMTRSCYEGRMGTAGVGACRAGMQTCASNPMGEGVAWSRCEGQVLPGTELCDGMDRDCDGNPNSGCTCTLGASRACYSGPAGTMNVGVCRAGTQTCVAASGGTGTMWGACANEIRPGAMEICTTPVDDNCNGMVNEGCTSACPNGQPLCGGRCCAATEACANNICVGNGQLRITMTWDRMGDMDLHVVPPCNTEIYYGRLTACGGELDRDSCPALSRTDANDPCNGPENIFWSGAPASGTYLVCANPWQLSSVPVNFTVTVFRGTTMIQRWTGSRSSSVRYVQCTRNAASFIGEFRI